MSNETTFNPFSLVIGILSVLVSLIIMKNPFDTILSIAFMMGTISIIEGIVKILEIRNIDQIATIHKGVWYLSIVLDILFGILLFILPGFGAVMIWVMMAFMIILNSVMEFWINQFTDVDHGGYYWLNLILSSIGLALGIVLLFKPALALSTALFLLSFAFMFFGITKIARSF